MGASGAHSHKNKKVNSARKVSWLAGCTLFFATLCAPQWVKADSIAVPFTSPGSPSNDLVYEGQVIDRDAALYLAKSSKYDLSTLDPEETDVWQNTSHDPGFSQWSELPAEGATLQFDSYLSSINELYRARLSVEQADGKIQMLRMTMALEAHAAIMRAALLRALGYPVALPKNYRKLTIQFATTTARNHFIDELSNRTHTSRDRWVVALPEDKPEVTLRDVTLEHGSVDVKPFHWGVITKDNIRSRRSMRALLVPLTLLDISERINLFSWEYSKIVSKHLIFTHNFAGAFSENALDDVKWVARKIGRMTRFSLQSIVNLGQLPPDVSALILEKFISRRNQLLAITGVDKEKEFKKTAVMPFDPKLNNGAVVKGKLTQSNYEGYALQFTYPDPESPLRKDEIARYAFLEGISGVLLKGATELNADILTVQGTGDLAADHQNSIVQKMIKHYTENPDQPFHQPVQTWGGPVGGFAVNSSRNVVTGTYYGSDATIQLVDNISAQANVGYFLGVDGIENVIPGVQANISIQRNYLHVRPVGSIKEALKTQWKWLYVPSFFSHLAGLLEKKAEQTEGNNPNSFNQSVAISEDDLKKQLLDSEVGLKAFLDELREGEIFSVTDTLLGGVTAFVSLPLASLLGTGPVGYANTLTLSAGVTSTILRRTTFTRTADGIQVYIQRINSRALDIEVNLDWWINIVNYSHTWKHSEAKTDAYLLDQTPAEDESKAHKLVLALKPLLTHNNTELLETSYKPYKLDHTFDSVTDRFKFLFWKSMDTEERHTVKVKPPVDPNGKYNPNDFIRTLYSYRIVKSKGADGVAVLSDVVGKLTDGYTFRTGSGGNNPANSFLGYGQWSIYAAETELTPTIEPRAVLRVEHHWGGWILPRRQFDKIIASVEERVAPLGLARPLIDRTVFTGMESLQMYDIQQLMVIYEQGVNRMRETLSSGGPLDIFAELVQMIGGQSALYQWCKKHESKGYDDPQPDYSYQEKFAGKRVRIPCVMPWMRKLLKARLDFPNNRLKQMEWFVNQIRMLEKEMPLPALMNWLKDDGFYFQVSVNGFRKNDENDDMSYVSDSIGTIDDKAGSGLYREFAEKYHIMYHEVAAKYLGEGF